jgi:hypothetical protein
MFADAIHFVDLFNYFMGKTPMRVFAAQGVTWATIETNYFLPGKFREVTVIGSA